MPVALAEAHDLVFDRGAIARAAARDLAGIHRRAMHVGADDLVRRRRRAGDAALDLRRFDPLGQHRERLGRIVARLHLERGPVDGLAVEPRRRAGLEPAQRKPKPLQRERKPDGRRFADPAGRGLLFADMDQAAQEGAGGQHHGAAASSRPSARRTPVTAPSRDHQIVGLAFDHSEVRLSRGSRAASPGRRACGRPGRAARAPPGPCGG